MEYMLLIYEAEEVWESMSDIERRDVIDGHMQLNKELGKNNVSYSGNPLMPTSGATSVTISDGKRQLRDGPFAETKEQLLGYYIVDVETIDEACNYAAMIPSVRTGTIEVRGVADHSEYT